VHQRGEGCTGLGCSVVTARCLYVGPSHWDSSAKIVDSGLWTAFGLLTPRRETRSGVGFSLHAREQPRQQEAGHTSECVWPMMDQEGHGTSSGGKRAVSSHVNRGHSSPLAPSHPKIPQKHAGIRMEPPMSVPMPIGEALAATSPDSPPLLPPGVLSRAGGHQRRATILCAESAFGSE
jgi:hypothetical protein